MTETTTTTEPPLADVLTWEAGAKLDEWAHRLATGDDLKAREGNDDDIVAALQTIVSVRVVLSLNDGDAVMFGMGSTLIADIEPEVRSKWGFFPGVACKQDWLWLWQTREVNGVRKPYADALEAAVAAWKRTAPPYSTDGNEADKLIETLREKGYSTEIIANANGWYVSVWANEGGVQLSEESCKTFAELPRTKTRAAIAALWNEGANR